MEFLNFLIILAAAGLVWRRPERERLAFRLAENGVRSQEDLAELSVDELIEIDEMTDEDAAALIMAARAHWFESDEEQPSEQQA